MAEPLKAFRFRVEFADGPRKGRALGAMTVSGLRFTDCPGVLVLSTGVCLRETDLEQWWTERDTRELDITVDRGVVFHVHYARPELLVYSDLDAGADAKHILIAQMKISYTRIEPEFI